MTRVELPQIPARQLAQWTIGVVVVAASFYLLIRFRQVVLLLLAAIILSTAVRPAARWLAGRGIPRPVAIAGIFIVAGLLVGVLAWFTVPVLTEQSAAIAPSLSEGYQGLRAYLERLPNILVRRLMLVLPEDLPMLGAAGVPAAPAAVETPVPAEGDVLAGALEQGSRLFSSLLQIAVIFMLSFAWTLEGERFKQAGLLLVPMSRRAEIRDLLGDIETMLGGYLLGQGLLVLIIGVMSFVAYWIIGLPHVLVLAAFAGIMEAVPYIGPFLGVLPALIVGLSISPTTALWVALSAVIIQQLENNLLVPRVMKRTIGVHPLVSVVALLGFGSLFGILGALIALPIAAVIQLLIERYMMGDEKWEVSPDQRNELSVLRYETNELVQDVRHRLRQKEGEPTADADALEDELEAIAVQLESYLATQSEAQ
jgi:predicted PurR-regulated permease PerM